jgi:signal transduction histidine kinase
LANTNPTGPRGIGFYLIALILLASVPLVLIAGVLVARQGALQREAFEKSLVQTAVALSVAVDRQLNSYRVMLETLAEDENLREGRMEPFHALCARAAARHGAVFVSLFDRDGKQVFNTLRPAGEALPTPLKDPRAGGPAGERPGFGDPSALAAVLKTGRPATSNLLYGLVAQRLVFIVNIPVLRDGRVEYVLNAAFEPGVMTRLLEENEQFRGVPAVIFDANGFIVGRWRDAEKFVGTRVNAARNNKMPEMTGSGLGVTLDGLPVHFSYARSPITGWGVNIGTPRAELEREVLRNYRGGALLALLGLVLGVVLALGLASRLRRSIGQLADAASRNELPRIEGLRTREIAQLERALADSAAAREAQARERESRLVAEARKDEAEQTNRMKDRFIAMLSHELRNPLAPLRASIPVLRSLAERPDPAKLKSLTDILDRQSAQLTRLVNDLLDVSRINTGRIELQSKREDLRAIVQHALESVRPAIEARAQYLTLELPPQSLDVIGDYARLAQVVSNLLDNATKFTPENGRIAVRLRADGSDAVLEVSDSGPGIPQDQLPRLFRAFELREGAEAHRGKGLGLGLSIAWSLVVLHGGSLEARNGIDGAGATFVLRIPLA